MGDHPYRDDEGRPRLRTSWVLYLDSMGTKAAAVSLTDERLRQRIELEEWYHRYLHHKNEGLHQRALYFTDNVVIAAPADEAAPIAPVRMAESLLLGASTYVVGLAVEAGLAYRGAMSIGPAFVDERAVDHDLADVHMAHGSGLVDAVVLEETVARVPRVVIADRVLAEISSELAGTRLPIFTPTILRDDSDGTFFLDHLGMQLGLEPNLDVGRPSRSTGMPRVELLERYRQFVLAGLAEPSKVRAKYLWLAAYYNWTIERFGIGEPVAEAGDVRLSPIDL